MMRNLYGLVLIALCCATSGVAAFDATDVPTFELRARIVSVGGAAPGTDQTFRIALGNAEAQEAVGSAFSGWLTADRDVITSIVGQYPNSYLKRYPVVTHLSIGGVVDPTHVELELRFDGDDQVIAMAAELWGGNLGVLVWREAGKARAGTMADYNRKYWAAMGTAAVPSAERAKHFPIIDRFIGGDGDRTNWREGITQLSRAGFNAIMAPPSRNVRQLLREAGQERTAWAIYNPPGYAFDFSEDITLESIDAWAANLAKPYLDIGYERTDMAAYAMSDEPGWYFPGRFEVLLASPEGMARYHGYLRAQGFTPADLGATDWDVVRPIGQTAATDLPSKRLFYWTMRFFSWDSAGHFADSTRAMEKAFYPGVPVLVNWNFFAGRFYLPGPVGNNSAKQDPDAAMGCHDWHEFGRMRGCTMLWTEDWFGDEKAYQWSYYCSRLRVAARLGGVDFGGYVIPRTAGGRQDGVLQKILTIAGSEGKALKYFVFGPEYNFPGNCYSHKSFLLPKMAEAHHMIGQAEDVLWPGRMPQPQVAMLHPRSSQLWDTPEGAVHRPLLDVTNTNLNGRTTDYFAETFNLYLALQHANIPTEQIDEDMLNADDLAVYRVLYVTGPNIPAEGQEAIAAWMKAGGTLVTVSGAGQFDRYNEPCDVLGSAGAARPRALVKDSDALAQSGRIRIGDEEVLAYGPRGRLRRDDDTRLVFTDGKPALHITRIGQGREVHFTFMPGISYWRSRSGTTDKLPTGFSQTLRDLITDPVHDAGVVAPVSANVPLVETPMLVSEAGAAITVLNWTGAPVDALTMTARPGFAVARAESIKQGPLAIRKIAGGVVVTLPLGAADIVKLYPER